MAFSLIDVLWAVFGFVKGIFLISLVVFVLSLAGLKIFSYVQKRFSLSWFRAVLLSIFLEVFVLLLVVYFLPAYLGFQEQTYGELLPELQPTIFEIVGGYLFTLVRLLLVSLLFCFLLLPLVFVSSYVFEKLNPKWPHYLRVFIAVFASTLIGGIVVLLLFPWTISGLLYLIFFA